MVILRGQNKINDFLMISAWASPFKVPGTLFLLVGNRHYALQIDECLPLVGTLSFTVESMASNKVRNLVYLVA